MRTSPAPLFAVCLAVLAPAGVAHACRYFTWMNAPAAPVTLPAGTRPTRIELRNIVIKRGLDTSHLGCSTTCDDLGRIGFDVVMPDQRDHAAGNFRVRLRLASGALPAGLKLPEVPVAPYACNELPGGWCMALSWIDDYRNDQDPFSFQLEVHAIDAAGAEGPVSTVSFAHDGKVVIPPNACQRAPAASDASIKQVPDANTGGQPEAPVDGQGAPGDAAATSAIQSDAGAKRNMTTDRGGCQAGGSVGRSPPASWLLAGAVLGVLIAGFRRRSRAR